MNLPTVNVIERPSLGVINVHAFPDTREGNVAADALFEQIARKQVWAGETVSEESVADALGGGFLSIGDFELYLVHSDIP